MWRSDRAAGTAANRERLLLCVSSDGGGRATLVAGQNSIAAGSLIVVRAFDLRPLIAGLTVAGVAGLRVLRGGVVPSDLGRGRAG